MFNCSYYHNASLKSQKLPTKGGGRFEGYQVRPHMMPMLYYRFFINQNRMDKWILLNKSMNIPLIGIRDVLHVALMLKMSEATTNEASLLSSFTQKDKLFSKWRHNPSLRIKVMHTAVLFTTSLRYQGYESWVTHRVNKDQPTKKANSFDTSIMHLQYA
jgi:hypothetical protein